VKIELGTQGWKVSGRSRFTDDVVGWLDKVNQMEVRKKRRQAAKIVQRVIIEIQKLYRNLRASGGGCVKVSKRQTCRLRPTCLKEACPS